MAVGICYYCLSHVKISNPAAIHNAAILQSHNFDMTKTIAANPNSHISYGYGFRTVEFLEPLLHKSPFWEVVSEILVKGSHEQLKTKIGPRKIPTTRESPVSE